MADRLPPDTIELVLSLAYDPPSDEDVDVEREQERRALLRTAALVCRRWRPVATAMLAEHLLLASAASISRHQFAIRKQYLDLTRTLSVTIFDWPLAADHVKNIRELVEGAGRLCSLRLAFWDYRRAGVGSLPVTHLVLGQAWPSPAMRGHDGRHNIPLREALERWRTVVSLNFGVAGPDRYGTWFPFPFGPAFTRRVEALMLGSSTSPYWPESPVFATPAARLRELTVHVHNFDALNTAWVTLPSSSMWSLLPALRRLQLGQMGGGAIGRQLHWLLDTLAHSPSTLAELAIMVHGDTPGNIAAWLLRALATRFIPLQRPASLRLLQVRLSVERAADGVADARAALVRAARGVGMEAAVRT